jgi:acyl-CoA synthetase (AMP-forming)/AMP-acid ligase II
MIIRGGVNIYPSDIESVVLQFPGVVEAAAVGVPSQEFGEDIAIAYVAHKALDIEALRAHCGAALARFKMPRYFIPVDDLPIAGIGKVNKKAVAATVLARIASGDHG